MRRRVLVTGSEGFTGTYVCRALEQSGWEVWGTGLNPRGTREPYVAADLTDPASVKELVITAAPHAVLHLAGIAFVGHGDASAFYSINLVATRNLLASLAELSSPPQAVVLASSANIYGNQTPGVLAESTPPAPTNDYAVSKLAMEYMAALWRDSLPLTITRPFNYTGIGQSTAFLIPKIVAHFRSRAARIELGNLDVERDFSDVRDVAAVYAALADGRAAGTTLNICSGHSFALKDVIGLCEELTGHRMDVQVNPAFVRSGEVALLRGDRSQLEAFVGSQPTIPLRETLAWMLTG